MTHLQEIAGALDQLLRTSEVPDYPNALNGIQVAHRGPVTGIAAAVDLSMRTINGTIASNANLLLVHHGLFWSGLQPVVGLFHERIRALIENDIAVYASHLPLDAHPEHGNNVLLAHALDLNPSGGFARFHDIAVGVMGDSDVDTQEILNKARAVADRYATHLRSTAIVSGRRTRRWGLCTGAGASSDTLREAMELGVDTLIVGEGPHWTAVEAGDQDLATIYIGHYATETFGVKSIAEWAGKRFELPWTFIDTPTGF
ncbi:MAG TPA: Nif3-like dinuclear metal center hexameric protein [Steroidobacteraceae bacterium]|nr:Nif3-like dinuclear metal center hexameric protein [Steroidobacteraceae bacterium]